MRLVDVAISITVHRSEGNLRNLAVLASLAVSLLAACQASPPKVTSPPPYPLALGGVHVTVNRVEYEPAVVEGLRQAGIPIAGGPEDLDYMLKVTIGNSKGPISGCGTLRNVRYTLNYAVLPQARVNQTEIRPPIGPRWTAQTAGLGARAIQIAARGADGDCATNVFNQLGTTLRQQMTGEVKIIDPRERFYADDPRFETLRRKWVHPSHASDSDVYYSNVGACMDESKIGPGESGETIYDRERFDVCMKSLGWRPE